MSITQQVHPRSGSATTSKERLSRWNLSIRGRGLPPCPRPVERRTAMQDTLAKPKVAIMNAVHDLPVLVARDRGFFKDEGLDIEFVSTPGMAQVTTSHS